ncbi:MAG: DUF5020 family protein [Piscirickettsiaceae bacterium]|nr:DUF5020 family protein [Piscirickettsiaceae bacterium]
MTYYIYRFILLNIMLSMSYIANAEPFFDWTNNNIQLLHGNDFKLGDKTRSLLTFEHVNGWRYGENFLFIEFINRDDSSTEIYGEFYPRLSWSKISGQTPALAFIKDFSLVGGYNAGNLPKSDPYKAYLLGAGISFNVPRMDFFTLDIQAFKADNIRTTGIQITPVWSVPFQVGSLHFLFKGYAEWQSEKATGGSSTLLTQPQLLLDVGQLLDQSNKFYAGIEYHYWHNKFGIKGLTEKVPQAMIMLNF